MPATLAEQEAVAPALTLVGEHATVTAVTAAAAVIGMITEPDTEPVWVEVAVMVAAPDVGTVAGAV